MTLSHLLKANAQKVVFTTALAMASCTLASAQKVSTDYDHQANFSTYRTFSIYKLQASSSLFEQRLRDDLTRTLSARGLHEVPNGGDLNVTAIGSRKNQQEYNSFYEGLGGGGYGWRGRGFGGFGGGFGDEGVTNTQVINIPVGTLIIDMYDGPKHQLVFRGMASDTLSGNEDKNSKKLEKSVEKILEKYPSKEAR
jgi:hypothetical protein